MTFKVAIVANGLFHPGNPHATRMPSFKSVRKLSLIVLVAVLAMGGCTDHPTSQPEQSPSFFGMEQCEPPNDPNCVLRGLTSEERQLLSAEATRLKNLTLYACKDIGVELASRLATAGKLEGWDRHILIADDDGSAGTLTGDYHDDPEDDHNTHVHLYGLEQTGSLIYKGTARHEIAHVLGYNESGATALSSEDGMSGMCS